MVTSLNISLPSNLREYVEGEVRLGGYSTPSEYVRALIREDQKRKALGKLESLLLEGLASGEPLEVNHAFWKRKRAAFLAKRRKNGA